MKLFFLALALMVSSNAFATSSALTAGFIVVQNVQDDESFSVQQVPIMGCYGLSQGPQLVQFTAPHNISVSMGCGDASDVTEDINALSCAKVVSSTESQDYQSFKRIKLDIRKCPYKNNKEFITMIRTAAKRNFPQTVNGVIAKNKEVSLVIIK